MTFVKGTSGNPLGKPKGTISEKTKIWNEISEWFSGDGLEQYKKNLLSLMKSDDLDIQMDSMKRYEALLEYFKPKLSRSEVKQEIEVVDTVELSNVSTKELKESLESPKE